MPLKIPLYNNLLKKYPIHWAQWETDIQQYIYLLKEWNPMISLVSSNDLEKDCISHIEDSLSLIPYIFDDTDSIHPKIWLDIGTGGGFPVIPILLTKKDIPTILIERKLKKAGFLQMLISKFQLTNTKVICDIFPQCLQKIKINNEDVRIITSRGIEKPEALAKYLKQWLSTKTKYLCQSPNIDELFNNTSFEKIFVNDEFDLHKMRRGKLIVIQKKIKINPTNLTHF